ncbi:hypothetical protein U9M48_025407 [Paspalum notatum var. saurae]|uniref:Uncharacterized protein n=1 Tax=Paspalum notatum var. saurae TaxID=547442 RepID=A0AAQ3TQ08_PASNO
MNADIDCQIMQTDLISSECWYSLTSNGNESSVAKWPFSVVKLTIIQDISEMLFSGKATTPKTVGWQDFSRLLNLKKGLSGSGVCNIAAFRNTGTVAKRSVPITPDRSDHSHKVPRSRNGVEEHGMILFEFLQGGDENDSAYPGRGSLPSTPFFVTMGQMPIDLKFDVSA